jgi:hypothetical protein
VAAQRQRESEERLLKALKALTGQEVTTAIFWPPLNPDPDCTICGGTGYQRILDDEIDIAGRCSCNIRQRRKF